MIHDKIYDAYKIAYPIHKRRTTIMSKLSRGLTEGAKVLRETKISKLAHKIWHVTFVLC